MQKKESRSICPLPFAQVSLYPTGNLTPCCFIKDYELGNIASSSVSEVWNGDKMRSLRREFLTGNIFTCKRAIEQRGCDQVHKHLLPDVTLAEEIPSPPIRMEFALNGQCNLSCIMCEVWKQPNGLYDKSQFWQKAPGEIFPYLKEITILGGEPFIQKDTYRLIDEINKVNKDCVFSFITNGHWKLSDFVRDHLNRVRIRHIHLSLDSHEPQVFQEIRVGGDLKKALGLLEELKDFKNKHERGGYGITLLHVVQKDNWRAFLDFVRWAKSENLDVESILLTHPMRLSIHALSQSERAEFLQQLDQSNSLLDLACVKRIRDAVSLSLDPHWRLDFLSESIGTEVVP